MNTNEIVNAMIFGDGGASKIEELSTDGGSTDAGKVLVVGDNGKIAASDLTVGEGEIAIDKGLVVNGAAADAKVVGDAISALNGSLDTKVDLPVTAENVPITWDSEYDGKYVGADGVVGDSQSFHVSDLLWVAPNTMYTFRCEYPSGSSNAAVRIHAYDANGNWTYQLATYTTNKSVTLTFRTLKTTKYIRISISKNATGLSLYNVETLSSAFDTVFDASYFKEVTTRAEFAIGTDNSITISTKAAAAWQTVKSESSYAYYKLKLGKKYQWHYKATVLSGNPYILMAIRNSSDTIVASLSGSDGEESTGYFEATSNMRYVSLFATGSTSVMASVKYSDVWIREVNEDSDGIDAVRKSRYTGTPVTLLHYSDIHGDEFSREKLIDFISQNRQKIDGVINTGDIPYDAAGYGKITDTGVVLVEDYDPDKTYDVGDLCVYTGYLYMCNTSNTTGDFVAANWTRKSQALTESAYNSRKLYLESDLAHKSMLAIGNHETFLYRYNPATDKMTTDKDYQCMSRADAYNMYIAPYADEWGITRPNGTEMYWYKDYPTANLRLVGIDVQYWDSEESTWLDSVLGEARTLGYGVILASHFILDNFTGNPDVSFQYITATNAIDGNDYKASSSNYYGMYRAGDAVPVLINYRDIIICNLCGHWHADYYGYTKLDETDGRQLLTIGIDLAGIRRNPDRIDRADNDARYVFNMITVDTENKLLKIVRFGNHRDKYLRSKKTLCIRYETGEVLANN